MIKDSFVDLLLIEYLSLEIECLTLFLLITSMINCLLFVILLLMLNSDLLSIDNLSLQCLTLVLSVIFYI
jgi:hypothetical protein